jgi:hypothetical protein
MAKMILTVFGRIMKTIIHTDITGVRKMIQQAVPITTKTGGLPGIL